MKVELSERRKREDILIRCGLLKESDRSSSSRARPKDDDDYSDDDDQEDDGYGSDDFEQRKLNH